MHTPKNNKIKRLAINIAHTGLFFGESFINLCGQYFLCMSEANTSSWVHHILHLKETIMTIADLIKYIDYLKERSWTLKRKVEHFEGLRTSQKIVGVTEETKVIEQTEFTMDIKKLMSEYDANAKELRLAQQTLERYNHTTDTGFKAKY